MARYLTAANVLRIKAAFYGALVVALLWGVVDALAAPLAQDGGPPIEIPVGSDYVLATLVVGFLMSAVISYLNGASWEPRRKAVMAFVWCVVASVVLLIAGNQLNWVQGDYRALFGTFLVIFVMAIGLYQLYFKPSGIAGTLSKLGVK